MAGPRTVQLVAGMVAGAMVATPVLAEKARSLSGLVGANAAGGESELRRKGFAPVRTEDRDGGRVSYWWDAGDKDCIRVLTRDGRYASIVDASSSDCGHKWGSGTAIGAAAVIGAAALGALLLSKKDRNRPGQSYQQDFQTVQATDTSTGSIRIFANPGKDGRVLYSVREGETLRNYGCESYGGESWCEVTRNNGRQRGWARDRYLRVVGGGNAYPPEYGGTGGWRGDLVEVYGLQSGSLTITDSPGKNGYVVGRVDGGTVLHKSECDTAGGERWCRVATTNGAMHGWARGRYLRPASAGQLPGYGGGYGSGNNSWGSETVEVYNLQSGTLRITVSPSTEASVAGQVGAGSLLRKAGCEMANGERWCRVSTFDGRTAGWARERYLRSTATGQLPGYGNGGMTSFEDLVGARAAGAMDELDRRGFLQVDNFTSGNTRYSIRWKDMSRQCLQVTIADGRVYAINDIGRHPRCR